MTITDLLTVRSVCSLLCARVCGVCGRPVVARLIYARSDPMWGVAKKLVPETDKALRFMTTNHQFLDSSGWEGTPAVMVRPPASDQMRGRYHVDPRGVCSPWVAYPAYPGEVLQGGGGRVAPQ